MFKKLSKKLFKSNKPPVINEEFQNVLDLAPATAVLMQADLIYSGSKNMKSVVFKNWMDADKKIIREGLKGKIPHIFLVTEDCAEYYFEFIRNSSSVDLLKHNLVAEDYVGNRDAETALEDKGSDLPPLFEE